MLNKSELIALIDRLRREPREAEWLEFKENWYEPQLIGEYFSALSTNIGTRAQSRWIIGENRGTVSKG